ncbi:unnamed protein product [Linum trigynum]|uniref:Uncharacterized protein n=1 Tax=Linum trigynum TaxID=586398 RepID=A0AAV2C810_9ROSI
MEPKEHEVYPGVIARSRKPACSSSRPWHCRENTQAEYAGARASLQSLAMGCNPSPWGAIPRQGRCDFDLEHGRRLGTVRPSPLSL